MAGRRVRRGGRPPAHAHAHALPLHTRQLSHSRSFWYCDFKIYAFNEVLFSFGRKYARSLRIWFTMGVGFGFAALIGATLILFWEAAGALALYYRDGALRDLSTGMLFGLSPLVPGLHMSIMDMGYLFFSTSISVLIHELGHVVAAARHHCNNKQ